MIKYFSKAGKLLFPSLLWNIPGSKKVIYLTFDDGPYPVVTPSILSLLKEFNAKATFFCIGDNVNKYPIIFQQVIAEGHTVGNHTFHHLNGWKTPTRIYIENFLLAEAALLKNGDTRGNQQKSTIVNFQTQILSTKSQESKSKPPSSLKRKIFRPPYGRIRPSQIKQIKAMGYEIVMWDVISGDYDRQKQANTCYLEVIEQSKPGSIVVFHDSEKASKNVMEILPKILKYYQKKGFEFRAL